MQVENHKEEVPFEHYRQLFAAMNAAEAVQRLHIPFENGEFHIRILGVTYAVAHPDYALRVEKAAEQLPTLEGLHAETFLLRLLLEGKAATADSDFKTFRELPWGEVYIKPFTGRVLTRAAFTFGTRLEAFRQAAERLGGLPLKHGDAAYEFTLWDNYRLRLIVWEGDDEFPPNAQLLYSANFGGGFAAEDRVVAGDLLIAALKAAM